jgi:tRNA nucleotidyltransferase (CCA-adding enzyme)
MAKHWQHFHHGADIGVEGRGTTLEAAFANVALAMTAVITDPDTVSATDCFEVTCDAIDHDYLLLDWLNTLIYEMAIRHQLFSRFEVRIIDNHLTATVCGEAVDRERHQPAVEIKGATLTELSVSHTSDSWVARCVVDV